MLLFFRLVAASGGTYYIQTLEINPAVLLAGVAPGLISAAILVVNNLRDIETDRKANKRSLAVRFGVESSTGEQFSRCCVPRLVCRWVIFMLIRERAGIVASGFMFFTTTALRAVFRTRTGHPSTALSRIPDCSCCFTDCYFHLDGFMRISDFKIYSYQLPLSRALPGLAKNNSKREGYIIKLSDENGNTGYGETAPLSGVSVEMPDIVDPLVLK